MAPQEFAERPREGGFTFDAAFLSRSLMPIRSLIICAITVALPVGLWVAPAYAQDPAVVNSKTIRVRFENDRVRVLESILPPGTKEQAHSHPAYVIYVLA